jgi:hypothetical protein
MVIGEIGVVSMSFTTVLAIASYCNISVAVSWSLINTPYFPPSTVLTSTPQSSETEVDVIHRIADFPSKGIPKI